MEIEYLERKNLRKIKPFLANYEFNDYRNHRLFSEEQRVNYLMGEISDSVDNNDYVIVAKDKDNIVGLASLIKLPWDTKHFGFKMAQIGYLITNKSYTIPIDTKDILLSFILKLCKKEAIKHLSCQVESNDFSSSHCLEQKEFKIVDTLVTYLFTQKHEIPNFKSIYKVRLFKKEDLEDLIIIAKNGFSNGRFHIDSYFPKDKAELLYIEWIKNCCKGQLADKVFVAEKEDRAVGFFTYKLDNKLLKFTGIKALGRGIAAVLPEVKGAIVGLTREALRRGKLIQRVDLGIFQTLLWNYEAIRIWQNFGMDFVCSKYTFHKWLDKR